MNDYDDQPVTKETLEANRRHDAEKHSVCMDPRVRLRARQVANATTGPLTDKKIEKYREAGWYSEAFKEQRRKHWMNKRRQRREGNFVLQDDGRWVYSPV